MCRGKGEKVIEVGRKSSVVIGEHREFGDTITMDNREPYL
jgi:hypothetical protein